MNNDMILRPDKWSAWVALVLCVCSLVGRVEAAGGRDRGRAGANTQTKPKPKFWRPGDLITIGHISDTDGQPDANYSADWYVRGEYEENTRHEELSRNLGITYKDGRDVGMGQITKSQFKYNLSVHLATSVNIDWYDTISEPYADARLRIVQNGNLPWQNLHIQTAPNPSRIVISTPGYLLFPTLEVPLAVSAKPGKEDIQTTLTKRPDQIVQLDHVATTKVPPYEMTLESAVDLVARDSAHTISKASAFWGFYTLHGTAQDAFGFRPKP